MVVVKSHDDFCVAVIECYGVNFYEDFVWSWSGEGGRALNEVLETVLGGRPLLDRGG